MTPDHPQHDSDAETNFRRSNAWMQGHADGQKGAWSSHLADECGPVGDDYADGWTTGLESTSPPSSRAQRISASPLAAGTPPTQGDPKMDQSFEGQIESGYYTMKTHLFDMIAESRRHGPFTPANLLAQACNSGTRSSEPDLLHAGSVSLEPVDPGNEICRMDYIGAGTEGVYFIFVSADNGEGWFEHSDSEIEAYYLPLDAAHPADVRRLFRFSFAEDSLGREVCEQIGRLQVGKATLARFFYEIFDANVEVAQSAVGEHASGRWLQPPEPAHPVAPTDVSKLLGIKFRPGARLLPAGWQYAPKAGAF